MPNLKKTSIKETSRSTILINTSSISRMMAMTTKKMEKTTKTRILKTKTKTKRTKLEGNGARNLQIKKAGIRMKKAMAVAMEMAIKGIPTILKKAFLTASF
jgi:hypothetical protein